MQPLLLNVVDPLPSRNLHVVPLLHSSHHSPSGFRPPQRNLVNQTFPPTSIPIENSQKTRKRTHFMLAYYFCCKILLCFTSYSDCLSDFLPFVRLPICFLHRSQSWRCMPPSPLPLRRPPSPSLSFPLSHHSIQHRRHLAYWPMFRSASPI